MITIISNCFEDINRIKLHLKKGVFVKNERGYRLTAKNNRFRSLLILLPYVTSIRRKLLKNDLYRITYELDVESIQIEKVATNNSDRKKNLFHIKQII